MKHSTNLKTLAWLFHVSGREKYSIILLVMVQALLAVSSIAFAWLLRGVIDYAAAKDPQGFAQYAVWMILIVIAQITLRGIKRFLDEHTRSGIENRLKTQLLSQLLTRDYAHVTAVHSGEWMNRMTSDTVVAADGMTAIAPDVIELSVRLVGALAALVLLVPALAYLIIPGGSLLLVFSASLRRVLKKLHSRIQETDGSLRILISERLSSLLVVRSFVREKETLADAAERMESHRAARMKRQRFSNLCNIGLAIIMNGVYLFGVLYCGYGILLGTVSYGSFSAVLQLIGQIQSPFANLTGYLPKFYAMIASAERLMEVESYAPSDLEHALTIHQIKDFYQDHFYAMGLKHVSFTYLPPISGEGVEPVGTPVVLEDVNLRIFKGECVAFTGLSGSGKSTILKLLMSLYHPNSGTCYLESAEGNTLPLDSRYTRLFAYVPQGNHLMSGSIREVVAFSDREKIQDDVQLRQALEIACALDFVDNLPNGMDTKLGERGSGLSEGQLQRIAIARAIFSGNPILVLDEATSALDEETEKKLVHNLRRMTDRTVLLVTHRPAMLKLCNRQVALYPHRIEVIEHGNK